MSNSRESIKVICRIRPENQREKDSGCKPCIINTDQSLKIQIESDKNEGNHEFTFDHVFGSNSKQVEIFDISAKPIINSALEGYNGTLFCYGQTSSGKTFTMEGVHNVNNLRGVIPRAMEYIFELIKNSSSDIEFSVKCSYLEIYNEKIQDLLDPRKTNLMVKEEKEKGLWVQDATEVYVASEEEMQEVFQVGTENRTVGNTKMNAKSSRSHSLFIITIFQRDNKTDSTKAGKLYFVDLAGSEKISKTGVEGQLLEDAKNINKSLLMLGMVINALTENKPYVPYRDSKLTRVLQESLGGNSLTTLIVTCSPNSFNDKESLSTLRFGQRAKSIKNKVTVNAEKSAKELLIKLNEAEEKIKYYQNILTRLELTEGINFSLKDFLIQNKISLIDIKTKSGKLNNQKIEKKNSIEINKSINNSEENQNIQNKVSIETLYKKCEDCNDAMKKVLTQHIELVTLQDELEKFKDLKTELESEIENRNNEIFEKNEKILLVEMQTKNFIKSQHISITDLILKLDQIFLFNQKKFSLSSNIKNIYDNITNQLKEITENRDKDSFNSQIEKIFKHVEDSYNSIQKIERLILNDNKIFNKIIEIMNEISSNLESHLTANFVEENIEEEIDNGNNLAGKIKNNKNNYNNINLNFNKNININIINSKEENNDFEEKKENTSKNHKKNILNSNSIDSENVNRKHKRTNSFSYFDKEEFYHMNNNTARSSTNIEKNNLKAINIFNRIKNDINFTNSINNTRKKLSLIIDSTKISKIDKINYYSPIFKNEILSRRSTAKESKSFKKRNSSDNSHSHSSNNYPMFDNDIPEHDILVEKQLKNYENYDCNSICTEFDYINSHRAKNHYNSAINNTEFEKNNLKAEMSDEINHDGENLKEIIKNQRQTILNLAHKYKKIEYVLFNFKKENYEKEINFVKSKDLKIKEYEDLIGDYESKISEINREYEAYKVKALEDFAYKEKKLMDLINKISDLEDENYRIIHSCKDTDKKKYMLMEKKTKDLTLDMQKVISENSENKNIINKRNEEINMLYLRISDLENKIIGLQDVCNNLNKINNDLKMIESGNNNNQNNTRANKKSNLVNFINNISSNKLTKDFNFNNNEVSFSNMNPSTIQSGICTPITNYLNNKNFDQKKLNDMLVPKLNNLKRENEVSNEKYNSNHQKNNSNVVNISEISNFSLKNNSSLFQGKGNTDKNNSNQNPFSNDCDYSNVSFNNENDFENASKFAYANRENLTHKLKDSNINNPFSKNYKNYISNGSYSSNHQITNSSGINKIKNAANKIMRVIKGGNGVNTNTNNQNHFFSKMLNSEKNSNNFFTSYDPNIRNSLKSDSKNNRINIDKLQREKFEQELRMLDCDDLNNSDDSEIGKSNTNREFNKNLNYQSNTQTLKSSRNEENPLSSRLKTPDKKMRDSIWNLFS